MINSGMTIQQVFEIEEWGAVLQRLWDQEAFLKDSSSKALDAAISSLEGISLIIREYMEEKNDR